MNRVARSGLLCLFLAAAFIASSCRRTPPSNVDRNKAPETYISRAPAESSLAYYRVHFYWRGSDPDGSIAYYEIAVTDSNMIPGANLEEGTGYTRTLKTDSVFTLGANPPVEQQILGHRIYVRAIDNEGKMDPTPAMAYFNAKNDYYPEIHFRTGSAEWTDKCGNHYTRLLNGVTDTIGVGGHACWSWYGSDRDDGGFVAGYAWKMSSSTRYGGGGIGDTATCIDFPMNASRRQILQVRGIDDGGLRSLDDYSQTLILNFDPQTWVTSHVEVDGQGNPKKGRYFVVNTVEYPSGTTLPDDDQTYVTVSYAGLDDPRDYYPDCNETGVHKYQSRILFRDDSFGTANGPAFAPASGEVPYPGINSDNFANLGSGDHFILIRSVDDYGVPDGTPDTVLVRVNYPPYIYRLEAGRPGSMTDLLAVRNSSPDNPIVLQLAAGDSLRVLVQGADIHYPDPMNPGPGIPADTIAAMFDSSRVVKQELGRINVLEGYRAFFESAVEPGYEKIPGDDPHNPYFVDLPVESPGVYKLIADVHDATSSQAIGRRGRVIRYIEIRR